MRHPSNDRPARTASTYIAFGLALALAAGCNAAAQEPYDYSSVDQHALDAPASARASVATLAAYLAQAAHNDREKARVIFRWITANIDYDVNSYLLSNTVSCDAEDVLRSGQTVCSGYASLFNALGQAMGLQAIDITGYGKGYRYHPGDKIGDKTNHAWNAVRIDGKWHLIDATWGAGLIDQTRRYVRRLEEHYFLTPPERFVVDHLPTDPRWQLLEKPISKDAFEQMVCVEPDFFRYGLELDSHHQGVIQASGELHLTLKVPDGIKVSARLYQGSSALSRNFTFTQRSGDRHHIRVAFPEAGSYQLTVFAAPKTHDVSGEAVSYGVDASQGKQEPIGFPVIYKALRDRDAYLFGPMDGHLAAGTSQNFRVHVPGAAKVAVINGGQWTQLTGQGDTFEGSATVQEGTVKLAAQFPGDTKYETLVAYQTD